MGWSDLLFGSDEESAQPGGGPIQQTAAGSSPATAVPPPTQSAPQARRYSDEMFGSVSQAQSGQAQKPVYDPERTLGFVDQAKLSFSATDEQWKYNAARMLYPNEDPQSAAKRFVRTKDGRMAHRGDDGKLYEVQPPSGWGRAANIGEGVGMSLPAVGAGVAGLAAMPSLGGSVLAAGIGGYAGDTARQMIGNAILEGPGGYSTGSAVKEGVVGAVGQGIGAGVGRFAQRFAAPDIHQFDRAAADRLYDQAERVGVRVTPAEATNLGSLVGEQKRLQGSPRATNTMNRFFDERNQEASSAWQSFLNNVGRPRDAGTLGREARAIAENEVTAQQAARTAAATPFYNQAEAQIASVNPGLAVRAIQAALPTAKGSERNALQFVLSQLERLGPQGERTGTIDMSFRGLNGAKMAIDAVLENEDLAAKQGIDRTAHSMLQRVRTMIIDAIDNAPGARGAGGTPGPYAAGRASYAAATESMVQPTQEILAPLLRANPANSSIVRVAQAALDPATRTPALVARARNVIERHDPQVWGSMVRQFLHEHAYAALQENAKGAVSNVGGNIAKRVGNDKMEGVLRVALRPEQFRHYQDIIDVFRATGRALDANSDTAFKMEAVKRARDQSRGWLGRLLNNINPVSALKNASDWLADRNFERQAAAVAEIYSRGDRTSMLALRELRQLRPNDIRRQLVIGHLLAQTGDYAISESIP